MYAVLISVRPILRIGEYSLVALQHRQIRYIGLRVSADARSAVQTAGVTLLDIKGTPPASTLRGASITASLATHASVSKGQTGS